MPKTSKRVVLTRPKKNDIKNTSSVSQTPSGSSKTQTQSQLGLIYVWGFLIIISGVIILSFCRKYSVGDMKDLLLAISGVLSGPLGFIIGFYFKEEAQNKNNL